MDDTYWHEDINEETQNVALVNGSSQYCPLLRTRKKRNERKEIKSPFFLLKSQTIYLDVSGFHKANPRLALTATLTKKTQKSLILFFLLLFIFSRER